MAEEIKTEILTKEETEVKFNNPKRKTIFKCDGLLFLLALIAFLLLGTIGGYWSWGWLTFFVGWIIASIFEVINSRRISYFNFPILALTIYLFLGLVTPGIWHPTWIIFIGIPVFYIIAGAIDRATHKK